MRTMTALLLLGSLAFARDNDADRRLETRISLDLRETKIAEAVDLFRSVTGLNFVVQEGGDTAVTIKLLDLSARSALRLMLAPHDLVAVFESGAVVIRHRRSEALVTRIYDVRAGTGSLQDFPGTDLESPSPMCFASITADEPRACSVEGDVLVMLVRGHAGDLRSWEDPGSSISLKNGLLVVRQTPDVHRQIGTLLRKLGL